MAKSWIRLWFTGSRRMTAEALGSARAPRAMAAAKRVGSRLLAGAGLTPGKFSDTKLPKLYRSAMVLQTDGASSGFCPSSSMVR